MATFSESVLVKKLSELNSSQQSIQTLSLWLIHHRKHYQPIVKVWLKELFKAADNRKITFIYLANDVIQNSKKKGPEYGTEFGSVLPRALEHMATLNDSKGQASISRVLNIWEERGVYDSQQIKTFRSALELSDEPVTKRKRPEEESKAKVTSNKQRRKDSEAAEQEADQILDGQNLSPVGEPPEPEELIKALMDLENAATSDVAVREEIARLPDEVSNVQRLKQLEDRAAAEQLAKQVNAATKLLTEYNLRLADELETRKKVTAMLRNFMHAQHELLTAAKLRLEEYQAKLAKVHQVRQEVKSHVENLPDIAQLPEKTGGLAPLPSAGDLFRLNLPRCRSSGQWEHKKATHDQSYRTKKNTA